MSAPNFCALRVTATQEGAYLVVFRDGRLTRSATSKTPLREGDRFRLVGGLAEPLHAVGGRP